MVRTEDPIHTALSTSPLGHVVDFVLRKIHTPTIPLAHTDGMIVESMAFAKVMEGKIACDLLVFSREVGQPGDETVDINRERKKMDRLFTIGLGSLANDHAHIQRQLTLLAVTKAATLLGRAMILGYIPEPDFSFEKLVNEQLVIEHNYGDGEGYPDNRGPTMKVLEEHVARMRVTSLPLAA